MPRPPEIGSQDWFNQGEEMETIAYETAGMLQDVKIKMERIYSTNPGLMDDDALQKMDEVIETLNGILNEGIEHYYGMQLLEEEK